MTLCPYCRESDVKETRRIQVEDRRPEGCLGLLIRGVISALKIVPMVVIATIIFLAILASLDINSIFCFALVPLLIFLAVWKQLIPKIWALTFGFLSWFTTLSEPDEQAHFVYLYECDACGADWSRRSYDTWLEVSLTSKCSRCKKELVTAPSLAGRCVFCESSKVQILDSSQPVDQKEIKGIERLIELEDIRKRIGDRPVLVKGLIRDGSPKAIELLAQYAADRYGDPDRDVALRTIGNLDDQDSIDAVCCVWSATRDADLAEIIVRRRWIASEPQGVYVLSALKSGNLNEVRERNIDVLEPLARACDDEDPVIARRAQRVASRLDHPGLGEAACALIIKREYDFLRRFALERGFLPANELQRALYYFMTEQWEEYDLLDFDRVLLRGGYRTEDTLQSRIREKLRMSGRVDFLPVISLGAKESAGTMDPGEIEVVVQTYASNQDWESLWNFCFSVPYVWSLSIVRELAASGWQPGSRDEQNVFHDLVALSRQELLQSEAQIAKYFPLVFLQAQAKVLGRVNSVAFAPADPVIAVGTAARKVVLWNFEEAQRQNIVRGFSHSIGNVAYTKSGVLVIAERTNERTIPCSVTGWSADRKYRLGEHVGSVTALAPAAGSQIITAGRDRRLVLWDLDSRQKVGEREFASENQWARAMCVSPDNQRVAVLHDGVEMLTLPRLYTVASGSSRGVKARRAIFLPDGKTLAAGMFNGSVLLFSPIEGRSKLQRTKLPIERHKTRIQGMGIINRKKILVTISYDGEIRLIGLTDQKVLASYEAPQGRVTSLHISQNEDFMVLGNSDSVLTFWDLRGLDIQWILARPFSEASVMDVQILEMALRSEELPDYALKALRFANRILRHRFRFDIEIGEVPSIRMGEFDIEID